MRLPLILDIGMAEMIVIGVVALIVVGPKDLPGMFRTVGQFVGKARCMARDFQRAMEDAADDAGVGDIKKGFDQATSMKNLGLDSIKDATASVQKAVDPLAEHAKRVKSVEDANKAGAEWPPSDVELPKDQPSEPVAAKPKKTAATKKVGAKKTPAKTAVAKKAPAKTAAKKPATKKTPAKKTPAKKAAT